MNHARQFMETVFVSGVAPPRALVYTKQLHEDVQAKSFSFRFLHEGGTPVSLTSPKSRGRRLPLLLTPRPRSMQRQEIRLVSKWGAP